MVTVHQLRQSGVKVRVTHKRRYFDPVNKRWALLTDYERSLAPLPDFVKAHEKGGLTIVNVTTPNGGEFEGQSNCSKKDVWVRKDGLNRALGKVFVQIAVTKPVIPSGKNKFQAA